MRPIFPNDASILRLVRALMLKKYDEWAVTRRYMALETIRLETVAAICDNENMDSTQVASPYTGSKPGWGTKSTAPRNATRSREGNLLDNTLLQAELAFDGAQGFGAEADGGRSGEIVKVTTLADSGPGSLRWALEELDGPRIVVFEVSGQINLTDAIKVNGDVTVAGQTSPEGITVIGAKLRIVESDVIIRGLQFRPGDGEGDEPENRDGISIGSSDQTVENVIIDSNSFSWSIDELVTVWYGSQNITISNNIMAEALRNSLHPKGDHSMGLLIGAGSSNVTIVGNLIAHNEFRNATAKDDSKQIEFINNLVYNYGLNGFLGRDGTTAHIIGNVYIAGEDSADRAAIQLKFPEEGTAYNLEDNVAEVDGPAISKISDSYVFTPSNVNVLPSSEVFDHVLANAGARYPSLTVTDERIIQTVIDGTGRIIDSPDDVGGYDSVPNTEAPSDRDDDGMPDAHEVISGTNPDVFDAHEDADGNGVSNIEDYVNGLIVSVDTTAPVVQSSSAPTIGPAQAGEVSTDITVVFSDNVAVDVSTIDIGDITVTGPGGSLAVTGVSVDTSIAGTPRTATY
ncbi:MAG: right-handed parallel beta-helix repeat-containing protein, partial [Rhodobacteraceae bacterium]|nr:right-handed parallel beta-helix repeat-containing protein [Paracoccaceae bacterium]